MTTNHTPEFERPQYVIDHPTIGDAEELAIVAYQSWIETYPSAEYGISEEYIKQLRAHRITEEGIASLRTRIERLDTDPLFFLRIAKDAHGHVVGFIDGEQHDDGYELQDLFTNSSTHGSGLGRQLWESFAAWVDPEKPIWLSVVPYTDRAPAFYKKVGFQVVPGSEGFYKDTLLPTIKMVRPATAIQL